MRYDNLTIRKVFTKDNQAFRIDMQIIEDIKFLLNEKLIFLKKEVIAGLKQYHYYIDSISLKKIASTDIEGGGSAHMSLKLIGKDYLIQRGYYNIKIEQEFHGLRPDIIVNDESLVIECGNTNPNKIFEYFKNKKIKEVTIISYPDHNDKKIYCYIFTPSEILSDFIKYKESEERKDIKKYLKNK